MMRTQTNTIHRGALKRIPLENVQVIVKRTNGAASIILSKLDVDALKFPTTARIILEYRNTRIGYARFDLGQLGSLHFPWQSNTVPSTLKGVDFRLLVVAGESNADTRRHEILGEADEILPDKIDAASGAVVHESLLAGVPSALGNIPWEVDCSETYPILKINNKFRDTESLQKGAEFRCLAIIPAVREIAEWLHDKYLEGFDSSIAAKRWWVLLDADSVGEPNHEDDIEEKAESKRAWANEVTENFARKNDLFNKWLNLINQGDD